MYAVSIDPVVNRLGCSEQTANTIRTAMKNLTDRGSVGAAPFGAGRGHARDAFLDEAQSFVYRGADPEVLADILHTAWLDGIQAVDRLTVELHSDVADAVCNTCGESIPNGSEECPVCASDDIAHNVEVVAEGPYAGLWADAEPCVLGRSWEQDGRDFVSFVIPNSDELVEDLESFGFKVDDSNYEEV